MGCLATSITLSTIRIDLVQSFSTLAKKKTPDYPQASPQASSCQTLWRWDLSSGFKDTKHAYTCADTFLGYFKVQSELRTLRSDKHIRHMAPFSLIAP